jgi:hypothetical protein
MILKSPIIASGSGSIAGVTFSHNRGGLYVRARTIPTNPNTVFQQAVRGFMSQLNVLWSTVLTPSQRAQWDSYAEAVPLPNALGDPRNVGGKGMYIRGNVPRLQVGLLRVDDGPTNHTLAAMTNPNLVSATVTTDVLSVSFDNTDDWASQDAGALLCWGSRPTNVTRQFFKGPYRFAAGIPGDSVTPPTSPSPLTNPFPVIEGLNTHVRFAAVTEDGRVSADFRDFIVGTT